MFKNETKQSYRLNIIHKLLFTEIPAYKWVKRGRVFIIKLMMWLFYVNPYLVSANSDHINGTNAYETFNTRIERIQFMVLLF